MAARLTRERRRAPRIAHRVPISLIGEPGEFSVQTKNVSASGVYCRLRRFLAPMTKVQVALTLAGQRPVSTVRCQGVVVRVEPACPMPRYSSYHVAIWFQDLSERSRTLLTRYIQRHLSSRASASHRA